MFLQPRASLLDQGLRGAAGQPRLARQAGGEFGAADGAREDHRGRAGEGVRRGPLRVHGDRKRYGEENRAVGVLAADGERHHRGQPGGRRLSDRSRDHRRQAGHHAVFRWRQGGALRRGGRAGDGAQRRGRARHETRQGAARDLVAYRERREIVGAHRDRKRLRQAYLDLGVHAPRARHPGDDRDPVQRAQRAAAGGAPRQPG